MRILNVAEKPAMAKSIALALSHGDMSTRKGLNQYCHIYTFMYKYEGVMSEMNMTSVLGHLTQTDFPPEYSNWSSVDPLVLFTAPIKTDIVSPSNKSISQNLEREARLSDVLIIWTDCDREGEAIGSNIANLCKKVKPSIKVKRARFSSVTFQDLAHAMSHLTEIDKAQVNAVQVRQEIDLRTGVVFTRFLTLNLGSFVANLNEKIISYGSCQFPTLGFVVEQYLRRQNFIPEEFWYISLSVEKSELVVDFTWSRKHLFDPLVTLIIYEKIMEASQAQISLVSTKPITKKKPWPLTTIALQKFCSSYLKIPSHKLMDIAETLYNKGFLSYPRTETDQFARDFPFNSIIKQQVGNRLWGNFANELLESKFKLPRPGRNNDEAHPPIHPTKPAEGLEGDFARVYEYVTRRFLACCSDDAYGLETKLELSISGETFYTSGSTPLQKNYMEVYIYDTWKTKTLPSFTLGETLTPSSALMNSGFTSAPQLLSESDLINTMDKNGIGTDATIHDHIQKIITRGYVFTRPDRRFEPYPLGIALIQGFDSIELNLSLSKPALRKQLEEDMKLISQEKKTKELVLKQTLELFTFVYKKVFESLQSLSFIFGQIIKTSSRQPQPLQEPRGSESDESPPRRKKEPLSKAKPDPSSSVGTLKAGSSSSYRNNNSAGNIGSSNPPLCGCHKPAVKKEVVKIGPNQGKYFYCCQLPQDSRCDFFLWESDPGVFSTTNKRHQSAPTKESTCDCGLVAKSAQAKNGPNAGRFYKTCVKSAHRCGYWEWADGKPSNTERKPKTRGAYSSSTNKKPTSSFYNKNKKPAAD